MIGLYLKAFAMPVAMELALTICVKASLLLLAAGAATALLRNRSAAGRYAVWSVALAILIALPIMSATLASWRVGEPTQVPAPPPPSRDIAAAMTLSSAPSPATGLDIDRPSIRPDRRSRMTVLSNPTVAVILLGFWLSGTVMILLRLVVHVVRVNHLTRRATAWRPHENLVLARSWAERLGIRRPVQILMSHEVSMPFSWGVRRPVIILPAAAREWSVEQERSVLLHELAHIARWDYPVHLLVEIVRALYWPNPLVWLAARRYAMERERACDDVALLSGTPSEMYASHLLHIARSILEGPIPIGATTMAGEPGLAQRVRCVMNKQLDRSPLPPRMLALTLCMLLSVGLPLASFRVFGAQWEIPSTEQLISDLGTEDDATARRRAAWWLGEHEDFEAVPFLIDALRDPSPDVRLAAGWALGEIKDPGAIESLSQRLDSDPDPMVREMAALALGEIENPEALKPLVSAFDQQEGVRQAVVWALGEIRSEEAATARAAAFAKWGREPWKKEEVWAGELENGETFSEDVPVLLDRLRTGDIRERSLAAWNLGFLGIMDGLDSVDPAVDALLDALSDPGAEVRAMAVWALDEINPSRSFRIRPLTPDESLIAEIRLNRLGYYYVLHLGDLDRAIEVFKANVELHPRSANCYDSLGEAYKYAGQRELAIINFEESLALHPGNTRALRDLECLRKSM